MQTESGRPLSTAVLTGQRNSLLISLNRGFKAQCFPWSFVQASRDLVELGLGEAGRVDALRKVLTQKAVGVLVGTALPRALRIAKVDLDVGRQGETPMVGGFLAAVPRQ